MTAFGIRSRVVSGVLLLLLAMGKAAAQSASTEISVTLVEVPVEVLHDGEPIKGLTAADFEVMEGKRSLPIVAFETIDLEAPAEPGAPPPPAARRHVLFFFDFSTSRPEDLLKGVVAAREVLAQSLDPRDLAGVGIYLPKDGLQLLLSFTADRSAAARTLQGLEDLLNGKAPETASGGEKDPLRLMGADARNLLNQGWRVDESNFAEEMAASLGGGDGGLGASLQSEVLAESAKIHRANFENLRRGRIMAMADTVEDLAETLRAMQGRKYLMFFSGGFAMSLISRPTEGVTDPNIGGSTLLNRLDEMLVELRRSGWILHAVDVQGAEAGLSADALYFMANHTGGMVVEGTNDLAKGVTRAMRRSVHSYLIGVQVDDLPFDGSYHELDVRLRNPRRGTRVQHRGGYFAPLPFRNQADVRRIAEAAHLMTGGEERDDLGVEVVAVPLRTGGETNPVAVVVEVPGERLLAPGAQRLGIEVYGYAIDEQGSSRDFFAQSVDLDPSKVGDRLAKGGVRILGRLDLPAGEHRLRVMVRDRVDGRVSLLTLPLSVAAAGAVSADRIDALFLPAAGDPWILVQGSETSVGLHGRAVLPAAQAAVPATGEAQLVVVGHGLAEKGAVLRGRIIDAQGRSAAGGEVELLAVAPGEGGEPDLVIGRLRAGTLPPGKYLLELRLGTEPRARALTVRPFRVAAAL